MSSISGPCVLHFGVWGAGPSCYPISPTGVSHEANHRGTKGCRHTWTRPPPMPSPGARNRRSGSSSAPRNPRSPFPHFLGEPSTPWRR